MIVKELKIFVSNRFGIKQNILSKLNRDKTTTFHILVNQTGLWFKYGYEAYFYIS